MSPASPVSAVDVGAQGAFLPERARHATGILAEFNAAGVLSAADVHVAQTLGRLGGENDDAVLLAAALTVRGTRAGSVVLDLASAAETIVPEALEAAGFEAGGGTAETGAPDPATLPWPDPADWVVRCATSPLCGGEDDPAGPPLRLVGGSMWLDRYFAQERSVAAELLARSAAPGPAVDIVRLEAALDRLFPEPGDRDQRDAAAGAALGLLTVVAGGPGTGKTTTVARLLAALADQPGPPPRVALATPTGKAAVRLEEAVRAALDELSEADAARVGQVSASTIHRLLGFRPGTRSRFAHDRENRLPHDVVILDETSMVSLTLMARVLEAVRPTARLILVGDPDQLASVEAGAVLGDIVGRSGSGPSRLAGHVVTLRHNRRFADQGVIARLAAAVRDGRAVEVLALLRSGEPSIEFVEVDDDAPITEQDVAGLRADVVAAGTDMEAAARAGEVGLALDALERHRLLCAHHLGPRGVRLWTDRVASWLGAPTSFRADRRYVGEPLLVTANDRDARLFNGDTGVVVDLDGEVVAAFRRGGEPKLVPLGRLPEVRPVHAMTVHKSQGSEFAKVSLMLPAAGSPLATRQTLYTAVTRASGAVRVIGSPDAVARSVDRPAARASGLGERLREPGGH
ncbi:exodeoxyribonuclease V subunit alpha [Sporichthya sp.]|uniref:exodeoxyribonuclease V subunit alpha n=1 Tax=Sporichthya sp. TaxID=65475 RepID=UPI0017AEE75D|nr:exodeoxyribonuclease V subunit alpha [Sporichthya sp.]MBA3744871.1 exodeoxyribonuclease V subunit alpha [Sporichthya sp.]